MLQKVKRHCAQRSRTRKKSGSICGLCASRVPSALQMGRWSCGLVSNPRRKLRISRSSVWFSLHSRTQGAFTDTPSKRYFVDCVLSRCRFIEEECRVMSTAAAVQSVSCEWW